MKTLYVDSSYLFRIYSTEPGHLAVKELLSDVDIVASAFHARAEVSTILHRKKRECAMTDNIITQIRHQLQLEYKSGNISFLPLTESVMAMIETVIQTAPASIFLRAADALHLACAAEHGFKIIYSNDRHMLAAAPLFGLQGVDVISD